MMMNRKKSNGGKRAAVAASFLLTVFASGLVSAKAQTSTDNRRVNAPELAATYTLERAKVANLGCNCFWLQGGSVEVALPVYRGFSAAGSFSGDHVSNFQPGVDLSKLS